MIEITLKAYCEKKKLNPSRYCDLMAHCSRYPNVFRPFPVRKDGRVDVYRQRDLEQFVRSADELVPPRKRKALPPAKTGAIASKSNGMGNLFDGLERRLRAAEMRLSKLEDYAHLDGSDLFARA